MMKIKVTFKNDSDSSLASPECVNHDVSVSHPSNDINATHMARLLSLLMLSLSYERESVKDAFLEIAGELGD